jgi:hypothetical protein
MRISSFQQRITIFLLALQLFSCKPSTLTRDKLISYIDKSPELCQTRAVAGIDLKIKFCPYQLIVFHELENKNVYDSSDSAGLETKYKSQYYFRLSFSKDNREILKKMENFQQYSDMLQVFSFEGTRFINATTEMQDTVPLADYIFEQDYGMSNNNSMLLAFKKEDFKKATNVKINIAEFGLNTGIQQFVFSRNELEHVPSIEYMKSE